MNSYNAIEPDRPDPGLVLAVLLLLTVAAMVAHP